MSEQKNMTTHYGGIVTSTGHDGRLSPHPLGTKAPSFVDYFINGAAHKTPEEKAEAIELHRQRVELARQVAALAANDVAEAGPLHPCSFTSHVLRVAGEVWAMEAGLFRRRPPAAGRSGSHRAELGQPLIWISRVLDHHDDPARVLAEAMPISQDRAFALRQWLLSAVAHANSHSPGSFPHLNGTALLGHWQDLPDAGRAAFPEPTAKNIENICAISPNGELCLVVPGRAKPYIADLGHALMLDGDFGRWLASNAPKSSKSSKSNGAKK